MFWVCLGLYLGGVWGTQFLGRGAPVHWTVAWTGYLLWPITWAVVLGRRRK